MSNQVLQLAASTAVKSTICELTTRLCAEDYGGELRAIVLTGSMARDEATFIEEKGERKLLGDAEFLLTFHERRTLPSVAALNLLRQRIENILLQRGIQSHVSLSAVHPNYFIKMRPHIFCYELRTCGQVVWGEPSILTLIPDFSPSDIPLEDAWRTLLNRMVELLEAAGQWAATPGTASPDVQYRVLKLYLDMATSFLLFEGAYEPTYRGREESLRSLTANLTSENRYPFFPLGDFSERVRACTEFKLGAAGPSGGGANAEWVHTSTAFWKELLAYARAFWRWELARLTGARDYLSDRELLRKRMRLQPVGQRLRGWAYVLRKRGWHRSWREWPRWVRLGWQASPRYWVYAAASELFFKLGDLLAPSREPGSADVDIQKLRSWLPLAAKHESRAGVPAWRHLASQIAWNYHEFLEGTRA